MEKGNAYVQSNIAKILEDGRYTIDRPFQLNMVGYNLMYLDNVDMAIIVFKHNLELFPDEANLYDSLGEAYMVKGDYKKSRELYIKAKTMDPTFANPYEMLKKLDELEMKK